LATWLVTGCSTGLGRAIAAAALERGETVVATARDATTLDDLTGPYPDTALALPLDVTDAKRRTDVVRATLDRFGGIDVLVNNAGHGYRAAVEEATDDAVEEMFATNFFGPVALIRAVLPSMRKRGAGTIVNVSSIGARSCPIGSGHYAATKAALEALSTSLSKEVEPLGLHVMNVEPGAFRTRFSSSLTQVHRPLDAYADTVGARRQREFSADNPQRGDPARAAEALLTALAAPNPPHLLLLGPDALDWYRDAAKAEAADADAWEHLSIGTDYPRPQRDL
jgi:NAD(P)-dependent dehydrogenase (short-subunit alcohol dehydrogenase family)